MSSEPPPSQKMPPNNSNNNDSLNLDDLKASIDMNCSICYEVFNDPLLLRCGHTFCKLCTDRLIISAREAAQQRYHYGTPTMNCPECRAEMPAERTMLVKNYRLADIVNRFNVLQTDCKEAILRVPPPAQPEPVAQKPGEICTNCKEFFEPKHLFFCNWCSQGSSNPLYTCGTCGINHHHQHQLTPYSQMATPEDRQLFVSNAIENIRVASIHLQSSVSETFCFTPEYNNLRNTLNNSFNHWEPVLNNLRTNQKLTKQEIAQHNENIGSFLKLCQDTLCQMKRIEKKHADEIAALKEAFSSKVIHTFDYLSSPSNVSMISMPSTSAVTNEFTYSSPNHSSSRYTSQRRRLIKNARRRITGASSSNHSSSLPLTPSSLLPSSRYSPESDNDDL